MKLPKLPTPESVDGRLLYTAGQMREYGKRCFEAGMQYEPFEPYVAPKGVPQGSGVVDDLMSMMGMKK